jgi:NADH dehydrogenase
VTHHYFGHDEWEASAPGLKTVEDALQIRRRILLAFETAERESDPDLISRWLTFVVIGGGPTGVELSGAIAMLANTTLKGAFRNIDSTEAEVLLVEGTDRLLTSFPSGLSTNARKHLSDLGVQVLTNSHVTDISPDGVTVRDLDKGTDKIHRAATVLWAAGVKASPLGQILADRTGTELDRVGRVVVKEDLTLPGYPEIFVIGDLAHFAHQTGEALPGVAQVAMQGGDYVGRLIQKRLKDENMSPFRYKDKGSMAVIGRNAAVADIGPFQFGGIVAWLIWIFIHISFLIGFDNKLIVLIQWAWRYFTGNRGALLITGPDPYPIVDPEQPGE